MHLHLHVLYNCSYPLYNAVARKLQQRMLDLGASEFHSLGLGDDQDKLRRVVICSVFFASKDNKSTIFDFIWLTFSSQV
jgi:hypothetical protein